MPTVSLRRGDWVEVLPPAEILATLDPRGTIDNLPFMPEMAKLCGRRFRVDRRTERVCDTVNYSGSRRLADAVMLEDLRCDGAGHAGCQADCRLIWKEAWLRKVTPDSPRSAPFSAHDLEALLAHVSRQVRASVDDAPGTPVRWFCQVTELLNATSAVRAADLSSYLREYTSGNVSLWHFLRVMSVTAISEPIRRLGVLARKILARNTGPRAPKLPTLDLQPGEWVRVKTRAQIAATLSPSGHYRGLSFDREMIPFCGKTFRVRRRVTHIIDDRTGTMLDIKSDCIALENTSCSGECSVRRLFCPRGIVPYWRECWLERVEEAARQKESA